MTHDTHDYTQLSNEQLSELIHRLSVESKNRYETQQALLALGVGRVGKEYRDGWDNDPQVLRSVFNEPIKLGEDVLAGVDNIDAKAPESLSEPDPDRG